jgi:hypothetical protein
METTKELFDRIESEFSDGRWPETQDMKALLAYGTDPRETTREAALTLLLHPPVSNEATHVLWLIAFLSSHHFPVSSLPKPLIERLMEISAILGDFPRDGETKALLIRLLNHLPRPFVASIMEKGCSLRPWLRHVRVNALAGPAAVRSPNFKRRWRQLRRRLLSQTVKPAWGIITWRDLGMLLHPGRPSKSLGAGRWLYHGRALVSSPATQPPPCSSTPFRPSIWSGAGNLQLRYMERLLLLQANELRAVRHLAQAVSRATGRVVLSMHNATLAAMSGWGFESLAGSFPSPSLWRQFTSRVRVEERKKAADPRYREVGLGLEQFWIKRLALPKAAHCLWEMKLKNALGTKPEGKIEEFLCQARRALQLPLPGPTFTQTGWGWPPALSPHQRITGGEVLEWVKARRRLWLPGFIRFTTLLREGQELLDRGRVPHLVLPWIDKFYISSQRALDTEYLPTLLTTLTGLGCNPLILFWDDTVHLSNPSLQLALKKLSQEGLPCRGIGAFDWTRSSREEAIRMICREHDQYLLFALRPWSDDHNFKPLEKLLNSRDEGFFKAYDSSWKDNLCFIYSGTQVLPLISIQGDREDFSAWIFANGARYPFGAYWRHSLRCLNLGRRHASHDAFSRSYALWANLF